MVNVKEQKSSRGVSMSQTVVLADIALMADVKGEKKSRGVSMIQTVVLVDIALMVNVSDVNIKESKRKNTLNLTSNRRGENRDEEVEKRFTGC
jgi:hypothetical protein